MLLGSAVPHHVELILLNPLVGVQEVEQGQALLHHFVVEGFPEYDFKNLDFVEKLNQFGDIEPSMVDHNIISSTLYPLLCVLNGCELLGREDSLYQDLDSHQLLLQVMGLEVHDGNFQLDCFNDFVSLFSFVIWVDSQEPFRYHINHGLNVALGCHFLIFLQSDLHVCLHQRGYLPSEFLLELLGQAAPDLPNRADDLNEIVNWGPQLLRPCELVDHFEQDVKNTEMT